MYTFTMPCNITSATIHPNKSMFVCGGDDFILYKYSIESGIELGNLEI
jgi:serine-threonine kinase receptor-associated protein